ncbi:DUF2487 family protein [Paenibacillus sp. 1011MAR3C5]|uniref:DUF2487 family protein n=1 Tax=Paenibacillus sp. 1011MAR3C5 TaxID=1675787 RepID=UPI000E6BA21A|nr:DUF2487 family protein [Paenibacillus sp. 1011MAR3C5]RJE90062.1 DUF2487 family protein [Paenibacillus sp. 1011MAR3C5]
MKFSDITEEQWDELKPYLDTCLLPVTGLGGGESPYEATARLERLRDMMDLVEIPFKGRVVTYPACHYITESESFQSMLGEWCSRLKQSGFNYVIVMTAFSAPALTIEAADLILQPGPDGQLLSHSEVSSQIRELWSAISP